MASKRPITPARLAAALGHHLPGPGQRIGLFGGSFNPAHRGHVQISETALRRLALDEVWWLVSPQNPLKSKAVMAEFDVRLAAARRLARHPRIHVSSLEAVLGTQYTAEALSALRQRFSRVRFVWLMGADNLCQLERWKDWEKIFYTVTVAVFDRPSYALRACAAKPARRFGSFRLMERAAPSLGCRSPPAWVFIHDRLNPLSATQIRNRGGDLYRSRGGKIGKEG